MALVCELNASSLAFPRKERERTCLPARSANSRHVFSLFPSPGLFQDLCQISGLGSVCSSSENSSDFLHLIPYLFKPAAMLTAPHPGRQPKGGVGKVWESLEAQSYSKIQTLKHTYDSSLYSLLDILLIQKTKNA